MRKQEDEPQTALINDDGVVEVQRAESKNPVDPKALTPLTLTGHKPHSDWSRRAFSPFCCYDEVDMLRRQVAELQHRMTILINRINDCDCG